MLDKQLAAMIKRQINMEWGSAYLYLDIHDYFVDKELSGFGTWFYVQTQEERDHAMLFIKYLQNNSERNELFDVMATPLTYDGFRDPLVAAFEHEQKVTASINAIYAHAYEIKDFRTMQFLDWFVREQNEEEKNTETLIKKYDLFGAEAKGLYMLDQELGARVYAPPSLVI